jgi:hypothetical protein
MDHLLNSFIESLRGRQCVSLQTLLKIAETKEVLLQWEQEVAMISSQSVRGQRLECITSALAVASAQIDRAEESILEAFCLVGFQK